MNLNQLEYFVTAAETLNFTKAAQKCYISQTAMTQQIKSLEKIIGTPLFVRDKHHVELTTAGKVYLKEARAILDRSDIAMRLARMASEGEQGEITVGYISGFGTSDCSEILRRFHTSYPNIKINLLRDTMSGLLSALERGDCDVVFTIAPAERILHEFEHKYVRNYPIMAVLYEGHPLSENSVVRYSDLKDESFIVMQPNARVKEEMEEMVLIYKRGGFVPRVVAVEPEPETIMLMISIGIGISIMPEYIVRLQMSNPELKILPIVRNDGTAETLNFEMVWSSANNNPTLEKMINWEKI